MIISRKKKSVRLGKAVEKRRRWRDFIQKSRKRAHLDWEDDAAFMKSIRKKKCLE